MADYTFFKLEKEHYSKIQDLYRRSFGMNKTIEEIEKKYNTDSWDYRNLGFLAKDERDDNAAYYGAFPIKMIIDGKEVLVAQSGDTMTAPEHQKKGLFVELAKKTYELAKNEGFAFVFGWPNENSYPGFKKKLDWVFTGNMKDFKINNKVFPLCELSSKYPGINGFYSSFIKRKLNKYQIKMTENELNFFNEIPYGYIKRDKHFFNYKLNPKSFLINYKGFTIFLKLDTHLYIGDVKQFDINKTEDFIKAIKNLSKLLLAKQTIISISENHWLFDILKNKIEFQEGLPIGYSVYNESIELKKIVFSRADFDTF